LRIALVKLSSLGDVVHALPAAHALRRAFPDAHLTWVVEARERAILEGNPDLDQILHVDTRFWRKEFTKAGGPAVVWGKLAGLIRRLRAGRFDVALDLQGLWKSGALTWLTGAPLRVGFTARHCREPWNILFTNRRVVPPRSATHVVEKNLALLQALNVPAGEAVFPIATDPQGEDAAEAFLTAQGVKPQDLLVALYLGAGQARKRWPLPAFRTLADQMASRLGARVLVLWGPGEESLVREFREGVPPTTLVAPLTSIPELTSLIRRVSLLIGGDTGPLHIGAAVGRPVIGLYGPTDAARNGPFGPLAGAIQSPTGALEGITVNMVLEQVEAALP
jgi:lipopolysaccharide heptosyltransferase I